LKGNEETVETTAEETKTAKLLMIHDFPITLNDFSWHGGDGGGLLTSAPNRIANRKLKSLTPDISMEYSSETLRRVA
jgi:hypothetical protein